MDKYLKTESGYKTIETVTAGRPGEGYMSEIFNSYESDSNFYINKATGGYSHAEGVNTSASGSGAHSEGSSTTASGYVSHAEGSSTTASGYVSHAEGYGTTASGYISHTEGDQTTAQGDYSHAEGYSTIAAGNSSHAEGGYQSQSGTFLSAQTLTLDDGTVLSALGPMSYGIQSHAEGTQTIASGYSSHAEGYRTFTKKDYSHAEGSWSSAKGSSSHAEGNYTTAEGNGSHSEGCWTIARGNSSHTEGYGTGTDAGSYCGHAEGCYTGTIGEAAHAEGYNTQAYGHYSHAEGGMDWSIDDTKTVILDEDTTITVYGPTAIGEFSHAEGHQTIAFGESSHTEGTYTQALGKSSHAEGLITRAYGEASHAEGKCTQAFGIGSHAEGSNVFKPDEETTVYAEVMSFTNPVTNEVIEFEASIALGNNGHAEGWVTVAGEAAHAEGIQSAAIGSGSHAEGGYQGTPITQVYGGIEFQHYGPLALGYCSHAEGNQTFASNLAAHTEGYQTIANGLASHAEGGYDPINNTPFNFTTPNGVIGVTGPRADGYGAHAEGWQSFAYGGVSHAEGIRTFAEGNGSHAEGYETIAHGSQSHAGGLHTYANECQYAIGHYNNKTNAGSSSGTNGSAFIVGNGSSATNLGNAFRVGYNGYVYAARTSLSSGADYAEYFEWADGNPNNEDRRGLFVTMDGDKIKIASPEDEYILGIVSGQPCIIGNADECWSGRYLLDDFGSFIEEEYEYEEEIITSHWDEENKKEIFEKSYITKTGVRFKENPDYDPNRDYISRADRQEWSAIGMVGVLSVIDDGTCQVNGYCKVAEDGTATAALTGGYRVIKRINDHIVKVIFK